MYFLSDDSSLFGGGVFGDIDEYLVEVVGCFSEVGGFLVVLEGDDFVGRCLRIVVREASDCGPELVRVGFMVPAVVTDFVLP